MKVNLEKDYRPSKNEPHMNPKEIEYFRQKLFRWRAQLFEECAEILCRLKEEGSKEEPDLVDRGSSEADMALEIRTRDRHHKLIYKIDNALKRIEDGTYGYCEETGKEIGLKRLEALPVATLSIEAQERHEHLEK